MTLDFFYGQAGELFSFYRIPKALFQEQRFQSLSTDAKTLYGILLDRMSLSVKNGWLDEQNRVFIIFTIEDVKRALCCADNKATKLLRELEKFGLIERKRRGLGKPSLVYVKNFSAESSKSIFQNRDFHDSGGFKNASQDPSKSRCNKTDENNTEKSETYPFYSEEADEMSKREQLKEYFSQSLEVELLLRLCPDDEDTIKEVRVGRDYDIEIILNVPLEEFEEFKSHSLLVRTPSGRKTDLKQAPVRGLGTPNGGIVVFDKTSGEAMNIMPKSSPHVTLRCQDE